MILINASHLEKQDPNMKKKDFENELVQAKREQLGLFKFDPNFDESSFGSRVDKE